MKLSRLHRALDLAILATASLVILCYFPLTRIQAANAGATILPIAGKPLVNLKSPQTLQVTYTGAAIELTALRSGTVEPTALAAADFDADGAMDIIVGYSTNSSGVLALLRGNPDAYARKDPSLYKEAMGGIVPPTFLSKASVVAVRSLRIHW